MRYIWLTFSTLEGATRRSISDFIHISKFHIIFRHDLYLWCSGKILLRGVDSSASMDICYHYTWHLEDLNR